MSDDEKESIEQLRSWREYIIKHKEDVNKANDIEFYLRTVINLIEKQQKEIEELKEPKYLFNAETGEITKLTNEFISKDKIREKMKENEWAIKNYDCDEADYKQSQAIGAWNVLATILKEE